MGSNCSLFSHLSFTYPLRTLRSIVASTSSWKEKKKTQQRTPDFQAQVTHLVIRTGRAGLTAESLTDPLATGVCFRHEGWSSYEFFLVHLTASSKLDKNDLTMAVIFLKILGCAGKLLRIEGSEHLMGWTIIKTMRWLRGECSAVQNLNQL